MGSCVFAYSVLLLSDTVFTQSAALQCVLRVSDVGFTTLPGGPLRVNWCPVNDGATSEATEERGARRTSNEKPGDCGTRSVER